MIICQAAEQYAKGRYEAIFVNLDEEHHGLLSSILEAAKFTGARAVHGDSRDVIRQIHSRLSEPLTVFLYLDPFGVKELSFDLIRPFLERNKEYSTELLINLQAPILHRLAARNSYLDDSNSDSVVAFHKRLSDVLGGDYWKDAMLHSDLEPREREQRVIDGYCAMLSSTDYLTYTGACPIQKDREARAKYYMIFASRHLDAMKLFNEEMIRSFEKHMIKREFEGTLFADVSWQSWRNLDEIKRTVIDYVGQYPGYRRMQLWEVIVQENFLRFSHSEYGKAVNALVKEDTIHSPTPRRQRNRLNDDCRLYPGRGNEEEG